jgi:hypothetical protein
MFATLLKQVTSRRRQRAAAAGRKANASRRLWVEPLEDRVLMSAAPFPFGDAVTRAGHTLAAAQTVNLMPMMESRAAISNNGHGAQDFFKAHLQQGEIFSLTDHPHQQAQASWFNPLPLPGPEAHAQIDLLDATGKELAHADNLSEAVARTDPSLAFRVPKDGTYYVEVTSTEASPVIYGLSLWPVGLNNGPITPSLLNQVNKYVQTSGGPLDVWLDGSMLDVAGPAGHGLQVRGNWMQTVTGSGASAASTYTATGTVFLETGVGEIAATLPNGVPLTVTTKAGPAVQLFGELGQISGAPLNDLVTSFSDKLPTGLKVSAKLPVVAWGVQLGSDLTGTRGPIKGAPLNAAFPYLYGAVITSSGASVSFGGITESLPLGPSGIPRVSLNVVADPADPFVYFSGSGLKPLPDFAVGYSKQGLIPYTPTVKPDHYTGSMTGNVYLDISGISLTDAGVPFPLSLDGDVTINTDPSHTGKFLGGAFGNVSDLVAALRQGPGALGADVLHRLGTAFENMDIGQDGTVKMGVDLKTLFGIDPKSFSLSLPAFQESAIWDGPSQKLFLHGTVPGPLKNTVLDPFINGAAGLDAYVSLKDRQFDFKETGQANIKLPGQDNAHGLKGSATVEATNLKTAKIQGISVDVSLSLLGAANVDLHGNVAFNGDLTLTGSAHANLVHVVDASADFTLTEHAGSIQIGAHLHAKVQVINVRGILDANLAIGWDAAHHQFSYSGSGRVDVQVFAPNHGWQVWDWEWQEVGYVGIAFSNDGMSFQVGAFGVNASVTIGLPH